MTPVAVTSSSARTCVIHSERVRQFLGARSIEEFLSDELVQDAVIGCLEVIGEAARQVTDSTRRRASSIPWTLIIGMRNILVHDYGGVNLEHVYRVANEDLPDLVADLRALIARLEREVGWGTQDDVSE